VVLLHRVLVNLLHRVSASSLNESMSSIAVLDMLGGIFLVCLTLIPRRITFGKDGPITDTFLVRTDNFWQPKNGPPGLVLALDRFWSRMKFFVTGRRCGHYFTERNRVLR